MRGKTKTIEFELNLAWPNECDLVIPFCNVKESIDFHINKKGKPFIDKPWFNDACKRNYFEYKNAVHNFNVIKSIESHSISLLLKIYIQEVRI